MFCPKVDQKLDLDAPNFLGLDFTTLRRIMVDNSDTRSRFDIKRHVAFGSNP